MLERKENSMSDDRYILDGKSFVDTKTNQCLNFGIKDLARVTITLNNMDMWLNQAEDRIAELEEQLKNAIVPKFKVGQEVYYYHIARNKTYSGYVEDTQWFATRNWIYYRISQLQRDYFWIREDELFATKEEAQAKLEELRGNDAKDN